MLTKYGFNDGDAMPDGVEQYRTAYILAMNRLLEKRGSAVRVAAFDRFGMHNSVMILPVSVDEFSVIKDPTNGDGHNFSSAAPDLDQQYHDAVHDAHELMVDNFVRVQVELDMTDLRAALSEI